jgi:diguanylate cyclase (GGDEF)-like protein
MTALRWGLNPYALAAIFPFHLGFDAEMRIGQMGTNMARICPELTLGSSLATYFRLLRPEGVAGYTQIKQHSASLFVLEALSNGLKLRGQMLPVEGDEGLLFLCSPWLTDVTELKTLDLKLSDFPLHDPIGEFLFLLQSQRMSLADAQRLAGKLTAKHIELRQSNRHLTAQFAVARILADANSLEEVASQILQIVCETFAWRCGTLWHLPPRAEHLKCAAFWSATPECTAPLEAMIQALVPAPGTGLAGHVWNTGTPGWAGEILSEADGLPAYLLEQAGVQAAVAFPIGNSKSLLGVMEFYCADGVEPEDETIQMMLALSNQIVQFHQRKQAEAQIAYQAFHDILTGLPNRRLFHDRLKVALARGQRHHYQIAVLFIDLDNFKFINDSLGHEEGDRLLVEIAERLRKCVRTCDTVARLAGDEFTVLIENLAASEDVTVVAERIVTQLQAPVLLQEQEVFVTASVGIALSSETITNPHTLLQNADTAMYEAKAKGKSGYLLFDKRMNDRVVERMELETGLRRALEQEEFRLDYQPIVELETGNIVGAEALLRWEHPKLGIVPPIKFIPLAEETGHIVSIGEWALRAACRQAKRWQRQISANSPFTLSVNLSVRQLLKPGMVEMVAATLKETDLAPAHLKIEITENVMVADIDTILSALNALKSLGVQLALDDFGTGYSSLASLQRLPLDTVKLDRAFVARLGDKVQPAAIILSIVRMCRALNMTVTGEGIETEDQLAQLQALQCDHGQGYLFSRPLTDTAFGELLQRGCLTQCTAVGSKEWSQADYIYLAP